MLALKEASIGLNSAFASQVTFKKKMSKIIILCAKHWRLLGVVCMPLVFLSFLPSGYSISVAIPFAIQGYFIFLLILHKKRPFSYVLQPSILIAIYSLLSVFFGYWSMLFAEGRGLVGYQLLTNTWDYHKEIAAYLSLCISSLMLFSMIASKEVAAQINKISSKRKLTAIYKYRSQVFVLLFVLLFSTVFAERIPFAFVFIGVSSIMIFMCISDLPQLYRYAIYLMVIVIALTNSLNNKREALIVLLACVCVEYIFRRNSIFEYRPRNILVYVLLGLVVLTIISSISIVRGYGGYPVDNIFEAILILPSFIKSPDFLAIIFENTEVHTFHFFSFHAIEYSIDNVDGVLWGLTYLKPLFVFFPTSVFGWKPDNMMTVWTKAFDPGFFSIGGSLPVPFFVEAYWNFRYLGVIVVGLLGWGFDSIFLAALRKAYIRDYACFAVFLFTSYMSILFARGAGLEFVFIYFLIGYTFFVAWRLFLRVPK